ncbi:MULTISPECIES: hypothetical protein [Streptomyces]|uniref:hypothetical protein n=1 Tax=Streptomyces TaxID=1883 RepID=UPI0030D0B02B|nr:hypothetical protein [Streptomyces pratensis]
MSGFARDPKYYGDRLVYEPLERKWAGYHARHCGCGLDWFEAHAVPAGFTVIPRGKTGYYGIVGPGLTEGVDEEKLTANALWEAVTGKPGTQTWYESMHVTCRNPESEAALKEDTVACASTPWQRKSRRAPDPPLGFTTFYPLSIRASLMEPTGVVLAGSSRLRCGMAGQAVAGRDAAPRGGRNVVAAIPAVSRSREAMAAIGELASCSGQVQGKGRPPGPRPMSAQVTGTKATVRGPYTWPARYWTMSPVPRYPRRFLAAARDMDESAA